MSFLSNAKDSPTISLRLSGLSIQSPQGVAHQKFPNRNAACTSSKALARFQNFLPPPPISTDLYLENETCTRDVTLEDCNSTKKVKIKAKFTPSTDHSKTCNRDKGHCLEDSTKKVTFQPVVTPSPPFEKDLLRSSSKKSTRAPLRRQSTQRQEDDSSDSDEGFFNLTGINKIGDYSQDCVPKGFEDLLYKPLKAGVGVDKGPTPTSRRSQLRFSKNDSLFKCPSLDKENQRPTPQRSKVCKGLFRSQSMYNENETPRFKRSRDMNGFVTPVQKRRCSFLGDEDSPEVRTPSPCIVIKRKNPLLFKSFSESEIKTALTKHDDEPDLVGDFSRPYILPTLPGHHPDLRFISCETMYKLLESKFIEISKYLIVDCRYPYEYDGGHIKEGQNIYTYEMMMAEFFETDKWHEKDGKRTVIIFHCEFSSERAPRMARIVREHDRKLHKDHYPNLAFPELYILHGGYKVFYETYGLIPKHSHTCIPPGYKPMLHENHAEDLKKFRIKSKTWSGKSRAPLRSKKMSFEDTTNTEKDMGVSKRMAMACITNRSFE